MRCAMKILPVFLFAIYLTSCVKPFNPPVISSGNLNYLVVDGFITPGTATTIKLSRTLNLSDSFMFVPELNAQLFIEGLSGSSFGFQSGIGGVYTCPAALLANDYKYMLHIYLSHAKQYVSDYVDVEQSRPIDSVECQKQEDIAVHVITN